MPKEFMEPMKPMEPMDPKIEGSKEAVSDEIEEHTELPLGEDPDDLYGKEMSGGSLRLHGNKTRSKDE